MRPRSNPLVQTVAVAALLLGACQPASLPPTPPLSATPVLLITRTAPPSPTVAPSSTALPTPAFTATPGPTLAYRPRPTVTPFHTPAPQPGLYTSAEYGISLAYPSHWVISTTTQSEGFLLEISNSDAKDIVAALFRFERPAGSTFQEAVSGMRQSMMSTVFENKRIHIISDGAATLANGQSAWVTLATVGGTTRVSWTCVESGQYLVTLVVLGETTKYFDFADDIATLTGSLQVQPPAIYGLPRDQVLVLADSEFTDARNYDPATTESGGDKLVFSGLVAFDPNLKLIPDLAESWTVTAGVTYTFKLRSNARFHNGKPVTAYDFIYAWERAADPRTKSNTVLTYLGDIVGVREMHSGQADHITGLAALDDTTLRVTIDGPKPYFLYKLTYPTAAVVDRANVESGPDWFRIPNGTGPYRLARWVPSEMMLFERNDAYYLTRPAIPYVVKLLGPAAGIDLYQAGKVDVAAVWLADVPGVKDPQSPLHADLRSADSLCTDYLVFDVSQPPFDDVKVRQAFTLAFDRQKYIDTVLHGLATPGGGLYPPGLPGYNPDLKTLDFDPARARQLLAESKYGGPKGLPPITYTDRGFGNTIQPGTAALVQMWRQVLGVNVSVENIAPDKYQAEVDAGHHGQLGAFSWQRWCADYPDPENFADVLFHTGAEYNRGHYSNAIVDMLLEEARVEPDTARRLFLYQQIEQRIVNDAPVLFTYRISNYVLVKPYLQGYTLTPVDIALVRYLWIDPGKLGN